ncbi:MAG: branched-chain amino acid ABC transporter permease [Dehalococcoides mccartyi]|uniref:Branched-chain amino acid ABC transporter, permease protein n=2 Tax=Dehalococcoides mccartyi TaxID=61435 RepID=D2BHZ6_DEHMV|nr:MULTISPECIES: branched-chain amino acid ABC transporter permease [Dehalococcoides]ACZ61946.1 branched-chain amino acid ABC transporter, permease protein [Dehalococcoides mccartyi VS]AOV99448.1 high-affinity branched-chain amino acid transport system permease protein LivH [Dehalococcoides mccartyi]MDP4280306.1 branched-chain amino acid ABC transporter permease [Dehalococcoides mccartyi]UJP38179.1 branched-chain amino acid ABC transporter permease [Dehalococcoides mccartyi]BAQ34735.1 ABC tran
MADLLQYIITGITVGLVYSLIALGFTLIWKSSSVANLALGQMVLICSWFTYSMLAQVGMPFWLGFICVVLFALALGWLMERIILRPLIGQPILSLVTVTLGVGFFLEGVVSFIWPQSVAALPKIFPETPIHIGSAVISQEYVWAAGISLLLFAMLTLFFKYHKMGVAMRATADDQQAVQACGIPVTRIFSLSWMLAIVLAAVGGVLMSSIGGITLGLVETGIKAFSVVILGGLDSFLGAMIAGPIIGLAENLGGGYLTSLTWPGVKEVIPFIIIIIVMFIKPYGLFGQERIERI